MGEPVRCQTKKAGVPCGGEARWWVTGHRVTPHACCDSCKAQWSMQNVTFNPLRGSVLEKAVARGH